MVVRLAADGEVADQVVGVVGDQVITATPGDVGKVVTVAADGTLVLEEPAGGGGGVSDHGALDGLGDDDHPYLLESAVSAFALTVLDDANAAAARTTLGAVAASTLDANSILYATADDTPTALAVAASRIVGRKATGDIAALTALETNALLRFVAYKAADESVTSSAVLQDDNDLIVPIGANEVWMVEWTLFTTGNQGADIVVAITAPAGASGWWGSIGLPPTATDSATATADVRMASEPFGTPHNHGVVSTTLPAMLVLKALCINGGTAGNVALQWAQAVSGGTATVVESGSFVRAERVA